MKNPRKMLLWGVFALLFLGILTFLWMWLTPAILIGVILPTNSSIGTEQNLAARYFQGKYSHFGLHPVKFHILNPPTEETAVRNAYKLLDEKGAAVIIGGVTSQEGTWLAEEAAKSHIPTFGVTSSSALLSGKKDSFFRICPTNWFQARAVALRYKAEGVKHLAVVTSIQNQSYVQSYMKDLRETYQGPIEEIPFTNLADVSKKIQAGTFDGVFTILPAKDLIQIINARQTWKKPVVLGSSSWGSMEIHSLYSGPLLDDVLLFALYVETAQPFVKEIADFEATYSTVATNGTHYVLSLLHMIQGAVQQVGVSRSSLKAYFEIPRSYSTAYGELSMDEFGDSQTDRVILLHTQNGTLKSTEKVTR